MRIKLSIQELLTNMNNLLSQGMKVSEAEKTLGYSDGDIRKALRKGGFKYDRRLNQYILKDGDVTYSDGVTHGDKFTDNQLVTGSDTVINEDKISDNKVVTCSDGVVSRQKHFDKIEQYEVFTVEQVSILHKLISEYEVREQIQMISEKEKGKTINRNIRVYEKQYEVFAEWCKRNNVTQADALYRAIDLLIK